MLLNFTKMQGTGNDYIYIDCFEREVSLSAAQIRALSERRFGVGSDGVIFIRRSEVADGMMDMYNSDGSRGRMCGNGVRCVAKYLYDRGRCAGERLSVETLSGVKSIEIIPGADGRAAAARVDMGEAGITAASLPLAWDVDTLRVPITIDDCELEFTAVSMGNPHAVVFTEQHVDRLELEHIGPLFELNELFPDRVNTEFVNVLSDGSLLMRVWERGAGETLACGTGACAVAVAAVRRGIKAAGEPITVRLRGGDLEITVSESLRVSMTGSAAEVFSGAAEV